MRFDYQPPLSDAAASLDSSPPALRRGASGDYSLLVGQALRAFASRSYVWLRCQTRTKLRPVHFESQCRLRSYEVLKRCLPFSFCSNVPESNSGSSFSSVTHQDTLCISKQRCYNNIALDSSACARRCLSIPQRNFRSCLAQLRLLSSVWPALLALTIALDSSAFLH